MFKLAKYLGHDWGVLDFPSYRIL